MAIIMHNFTKVLVVLSIQPSYLCYGSSTHHSWNKSNSLLLLHANPQHNLLHNNGILSPAIIIFSSFLIFHHDGLQQFWFLSITHHAHTNLFDLNDLYMHSIIGHHLLKEMGNEIGISYSYKLPQLCLM